MTTWIVISLDMWGHVHADCEEDCPCGGPDADCCDHCGEEENNRHKVGAIEAADEATDAELIELLISEGFLAELARNKVALDDYSDGYEIDVVDDDGRKLFVLQKKDCNQ